MAVDLSDLDAFMSYKQVAELLGITGPTLNSVIARGELLAVRITDRSHRIGRDSLAAYMEGCHGVAPQVVDDVPHAMNVTGVGSLLGISPHVVRQIIESGELRHFLVGTRVRVAREELADFIKRHTTSAAPVD